MAILRKQSGIQCRRTELLQISSVTLFKRFPVYEALAAAQMTELMDEEPSEIEEERNQLIWFNFHPESIDYFWDKYARWIIKTRNN